MGSSEVYVGGFLVSSHIYTSIYIYKQYIYIYIYICIFISLSICKEYVAQLQRFELEVCHRGATNHHAPTSLSSKPCSRGLV